MSVSQEIKSREDLHQPSLSQEGTGLVQQTSTVCVTAEIEARNVDTTELNPARAAGCSRRG